MKQLSKYPTDKIKNIVVTGHGNSGKTSLVEAMLYLSGATDRMGKTADGTAVCDFDCGSCGMEKCQIQYD